MMLSISSYDFFVICRSSVKCLFISFSHFLNEFFFFIFELKFFFACFGYGSFSQGNICKYFLIVHGLSFHSLNIVFNRAEVFYLNELQLTSFFFHDCSFVLVSKNILPTSRYLHFLLCHLLEVLFLYFTFIL